MKQDGNVYAIIVAAGRGSRFGADLPKQFCDLDGRPVLMHTVEAFAERIGLDRILLVIDPSYTEFWRELCRKHGFASPELAAGGSTRSRSVANAVSRLDCPCDAIVMVHDGARPLVSGELIERMSTLPDGYVGAIPCVPVTDSLRLVEGELSSAVDRSRYYAVQTPQTFSASTLRRAYEADVDDPAITDDASAVERLGLGLVAIVPGDPRNIKITNPMDIRIASAISASYRR